MTASGTATPSERSCGTSQTTSSSAAKSEPTLAIASRLSRPPPNLTPSGQDRLDAIDARDHGIGLGSPRGDIFAADVEPDGVQADRMSSPYVAFVAVADHSARSTYSVAT